MNKEANVERYYIEDHHGRTILISTDLLTCLEIMNTPRVSAGAKLRRKSDGILLAYRGPPPKEKGTHDDV